MTGLDAAKLVDAASDALVKVLGASGPFYRPGENSAAWIYALDPTAPLGFRMFAAQKASNVGVPEPGLSPIPVAPIAPVAPMPQPAPIPVTPIQVPPAATAIPAPTL